MKDRSSLDISLILISVGTNHLGHFYLNHLLLPKLKNDSKIVVTASSVHDPDSPGGAQGVPASLGSLQGFERDGRHFSMVDGEAFNADKAYKDSKVRVILLCTRFWMICWNFLANIHVQLCNVLFTRELQRRLEQSPATKDITVNCFSPGLITSGSFFRYQNQVFSKVCIYAVISLLYDVDGV